jgi:hypothetical protein
MAAEDQGKDYYSVHWQLTTLTSPPRGSHARTWWNSPALDDQVRVEVDVTTVGHALLALVEGIESIIAGLELQNKIDACKGCGSIFCRSRGLKAGFSNRECRQGWFGAAQFAR